MALREVYVTNATGNVINQYSIAAGIQAIVYVPTDTAYGDLISFHWGPLTPLERAYLPGDFPNFTWIINVLNAFPQQEALSNGVYAVGFSITDFLGNETASPDRTITVENSPISNPNFVAPLAQATINQAQWIAGFNVTIPASPNIQTGDTYTLYARANEIAKVFKTDSVTATNTDIVVPSGASNTALAGLDGVNTFFYYSIVRGTTAVGTSASKTVYIDVVPPGGA